MVLFGSEKDGDISPWMSAWFGYFEDFDDTAQIPMEDRDVYKQDLFGLKTMNEQGRIVRLDSGLQHLEYPLAEDFIKSSVAQYVVMLN
jgi:palmitoyl-protein thioesterase